MIRAALIAYSERAIGEDAGWARDVSALGRTAFWRLLGFYRFAGFRRSAPLDLLTLARLGAVMAEDCGPCTRIVVKVAKKQGIQPDLLRAALAGGEGLSGDADLAFRFGRALSAGDADADTFGDAIEVRHGRAVRTELALGAAAARFYPAIKRGLGYARACSLTRFDDL